MTDQSQAEDITLVEQQEQQALVLQNQVGELVVSDDMSFAKMQSIEATAKDNVKALEAQMEIQIKDAHAKHRKLTALRNQLTSPFKEVAKAARSKCIKYQQEQQRIAQEEARKAREAEMKAQEEARIAAATEAEKQGKTEEAENIIEAPITPPPAAPVKETVKVKNARTIVQAEIYDVPLLFKSLAEKPPTLDERQIEELIRVMRFNKLATAMGDNTEKMFPGLRAIKKIV